MAIVEVLLPTSKVVAKDSTQEQWREIINAQLAMCLRRTCGPGKTLLFPNRPDDYIEVAANGKATLVFGNSQQPLEADQTYIVSNDPENADSLLLWGVILNVGMPS